MRVQLNNTGTLSLAEVEVIGRASNEEIPPIASNLSVGRPTEQSTTAFNGASLRAVDGNTNGRYSARSVTHTSTSSNQAWWQVDLGNQAIIDSILLFNRTDSCCTSRLSNFYVLISPQPFGNRSLTELLSDSTVVSSFHSSLDSSFLEIDFDSTQGQYVRVQLQGAGALSLAEVEVLGNLLEGQPPLVSNLSLGKAVQQHSTAHGGAASRAVDGNTTGLYFSGSVTHTSPTNQPWWQVDLAEMSLIDSIVIHNRTDCCIDRLANFYVLVSEQPFGNRSLNDLLADPLIESRFQANLLSSWLELELDNVKGRYVRIQLLNHNPLSLAEVQVMGVVQ